MTKGEIIGQAILKISGGSPSADTSVWYSDLESYLPSAINKVMLGSYDVAQRQENFTGINPLFLQVFDSIAVTLDATKKRFKFTYPKKVVSFTGGEGVQYVGNVTGKQFKRTYPDNGTLESFYDKINTEVTSFSTEGEIGYLYNYSPVDTPLMVKQVVHINSLDGTDEILLPSGSELEVIGLLVQFFTDQRLMAKDAVIDGRDSK